jgi:dTMP kinase
VERAMGPALARGDVVLVDRFFLSTYAYQIAGHGLPEREVRSANAFATNGLVPDLTILLIYPMLDGLGRAARRDAAPDRMEAMGEPFHERVAEAFGTFASPAWQAEHPECGPIVAVDGAGEELEVALRIRAELHSRWPGTFPAFVASER